MEAMSYSKFTFLIALITLSMSKTEDIQIIDTLGNTGAFPKSFVDQSEYFQGLMEMPSYQEPFLLPENISTAQLNDLYIASVADFSNIPLNNLTQYFIIANQLLNEELQNSLEAKIFEQLSKLPTNNPDAINARKTLQHILALPKENFEKTLNNRLILNKTNISNKKLHSPIFTQKLQDQVTRECSLQIPSTQIAYALPVYSSSHAGCIIITKTPELHFFINNEDIVYDNPDELLATFSWQKIKIAAYNNDLTQNAFGNTEKEILIISSDLSSTIINTGSIASNAPYTHLAFSCDGNYLTCIVDNKAYIINIATQKITPVIIPAKIFSSILVSDSVLLIRTINGNTYAYNLVSEKLKHIPQSKIDYFTTCYHENNQLHLYGFIEKIKPNKEIVTENATENIDLLAIA